ncbi:MAG: FGGY-family carbohydrate kinase [Desulfobacterales bacterium]|nr:FGGY-family carbohydrate kinase [Desulfobacterales bacterium]MDJ0875550.1 FGGY-family carbohydrate kinase [Desulfobacterales bacterium]
MKGAKSTDELILVFDAGTQSIRAALIDLEGHVEHIVRTPITPYFSHQPGWAEQDPGYFWENLAATSRKLLGTDGVDRDRIAGMTLTSQRDTVINLDKYGNPLRPAIIWLDQRKAEQTGNLSLLFILALKAINKYDLLKRAERECKANWIRQHQPEIWAQTAKLLLLSGYLTFKLTGDYQDSAGNMVSYLPFDFKRQRWARARDLKWKIFPMDPAVLPKLIQPSALLGHVTAQAAAETGIPEGLPVIAAATDKACEVLGAGCRTPQIACLSYGTTATVNTANDRYVEIQSFMPPYPSALPGYYNTEVMVYRGFWMVSWFKREFGLRERQIARARNIAPEVLFDELIAEIPPGSMGLTLQPYWSPGIKTGAAAKGAIIGFGDVHTRAHIYRAILEGLGYALKDGALTLEKRNKVPIEGLRVSGGGSQSDAAMQITADIFDLPAQRPHTYETSALGAAIDAAVGLGFYPDFAAAVAAMTRITRVFEPVPANRDLYQALFENVYRKMYGRLKPIYEDIRAITGYPASS